MKKSSLKIRKLHKDNRGAGIATVLIVMGFLSLLVAGLLATSYMGYRVILSDRQSKDNFYTAESVLDDINVGLQGEISTALSEAYAHVMSNYSFYGDSDTRTAKLYELYTKKLNKLLQKDPDDASTAGIYSISKLRSYVSVELLGDGDASRDNFGSYGAIVESDACPLTVVSGDGIILKDLKITYVNSQGYVSMLSTDIHIALPDVNFGQSSAMLDVYKYSIVADKGLMAGNRHTGRVITISGDVYAADMTLGKQKITSAGGSEYQLMNDVTVKFMPSSFASNIKIVSKGEIQVNGGKLVTEPVSGGASETAYVDLWGGDIVLDGSAADLNGNTYVANDIRLEKSKNVTNGSTLKLAGTYMGFGYRDENADSVVSADESSAIVVNGMNSSLDFSDLSSLSIGGHTYVSVSAKKTNVPGVSGEEVWQEAGADEEGASVTEVLMGESVAVKSNQLVYMVPSEALGCVKNADGTVGESVFRSNPMKIEQYQEILQNSSKYVLLDVNRGIKSLGKNASGQYHTLSEYMSPTNYKPIVVTKQTNAGTLVYFYMQFVNQQAANRYFRDYYGVNEEQVDKYTRIYAEAIEMPDSTTNPVYLHLAGNVLSYEKPANAQTSLNTEVIAATDGSEQMQMADVAFSLCKDKFRALTCKMETDLDKISAEEQARSVFENMVAEDKLEAIVEVIKGGSGYTTATVNTGAGIVVLTTGNYTINSGNASGVSLVVAKGDVSVGTSFKGTVIAGGKVTVFDGNGDGENVKLQTISLEEFNQILRAPVKKELDGTATGYYVANVFKDGSGYMGEASATGNNFAGVVELDKLITYERWSKE